MDGVHAQRRQVMIPLMVKNLTVFFIFISLSACSWIPADHGSFSRQEHFVLSKDAAIYLSDLSDTGRLNVELERRVLGIQAEALTALSKSFPKTKSSDRKQNLKSTFESARKAEMDYVLSLSLYQFQSSNWTVKGENPAPDKVKRMEMLATLYHVDSEQALDNFVLRGYNNPMDFKGDYPEEIMKPALRALAKSLTKPH